MANTNEVTPNPTDVELDKPTDNPKAEESKAEAPNPSDAEILKLKNMLSKANSECADYKRQLRAKLSEEEANKLDAEEKQKALEEKLAKFEFEATVSKYEAQFTKLGFDGELARKTAEAKANGDTETEFANILQLLESVKKNATVNQMANQTNLSGGVTSNIADNITQEQFNKMDYSERLSLYQNNKALFDKLSKGE